MSRSFVHFATQPALFRRALRTAARAALVLCAISCTTICIAQSAPSGYQSRSSLWLGALYANSSASFPYGDSLRLNGLAITADYHWIASIGLEGEARWMPWGGFATSTESSYLGGATYRFHRFKRVQPYAKFLLGDGHIHYPYAIGDASYLALAPGAGIHWNLSPRLALRADYEYQYWRGSPGFAAQPDHPITPTGLQLGFTWRLATF